MAINYSLDEDEIKEIDGLIKSYGLKDTIEMLQERLEGYIDEGLNTSIIENKLAYLYSQEIEEEFADDVPDIADNGVHEEAEESDEKADSKEDDLGDE